MQSNPARNNAFWLTLAYAVVIAYSSLHPLEALRYAPQVPWAFIARGLPRIGVTSFDVWLNVWAYVPLGMGLCWLVLHPSGGRRVANAAPWVLRALVALLAASAGGALLSLCMESLQSYSPARVASLIDVLTNTAGAALGAMIVVAAHLLLGRRLQRLIDWLLASIAPQRGAVWAVVGLWALAQLHPQGWAFMTAPLASLLTHYLSAGAAPNLVQGIALPPAQLQSLETIAVVVALTGVLSLCRMGLHPRVGVVGRGIVLGLALIVIVSWQALAYVVQYGPGQWNLLLSLGVIHAMWPVAAVWLLLTITPSVFAPVLGVGALALHVALAQMLPIHPYVASAPLWQQGKFIHLYGLTQIVSALWPVLALGALVLQSRYRHNKHNQ